MTTDRQMAMMYPAQDEVTGRPGGEPTLSRLTTPTKQPVRSVRVVSPEGLVAGDRADERSDRSDARTAVIHGALSWQGAIPAEINTATTRQGMPAMETQEFGDDDGVMAQRTRTSAMLNQIARQAKQALTEQSIDMDLFFLIPNSGDAVLTYGTITDPPDDLWDRVGEIVSSVVRQFVGLERTRCQPVVCATTESANDHQHSPTPDLTPTSGAKNL